MLSCLPACLSLVAAVAAAQAPPVFEERADWAAKFRAAGVTGTAVVYDESAGRWFVHDRERATRPFSPASTFKLFSALVALETGAVADEHEVVRWDPATPRPPGWETGELPASWTRDQTLASALAVSAVWFYREVARRVGKVAMQDALDRAGYGNRDLAGGLDRFWLDGALRISAVEQVDFLRRLADGSLPFRAGAQETVRRISIVRSAPDHVLHAKTGWALPPDPARAIGLGWYVGWLERGGRRWFFALNVDLRTAADARLRAELADEILRQVGALPR